MGEASSSHSFFYWGRSFSKVDERRESPFFLSIENSFCSMIAFNRSINFIYINYKNNALD